MQRILALAASVLREADSLYAFPGSDLEARVTFQIEVDGLAKQVTYQKPIENLLVSTEANHDGLRRLAATLTDFASFVPPPFAPYPGRPWKDAAGGPVANAVIQVFTSCPPVAFLQLGWPLGTDYHDTEMWQYVRDPQHSLPWFDGRFSKDVDIPSDAVFTGYRNGEMELWLSPSTRDRFAYLVTDDRTEAWPRANPPTSCGG